MLASIVTFLFLQSGLGQPVAKDATVRPYAACGIMLAKGRFTADVPFIKVDSADGKPSWFVGATVRYSIKVGKEK